MSPQRQDDGRRQEIVDNKGNGAAIAKVVQQLKQKTLILMRPGVLTLPRYLYSICHSRNKLYRYLHLCTDRRKLPK